MSKPLWLKHAEEERHFAALTAQFARESGDELPPEKRQVGRITPTDARRLRGIPVVGVEGVGGAISGSKPGA